MTNQHSTSVHFLPLSSRSEQDRLASSELLHTHLALAGTHFNCIIVNCHYCCDQSCGDVQELASKSRMVEEVVAALRNEEAAKLAAQQDAQAARTRIHQLEVHAP